VTTYAFDYLFVTLRGAELDVSADDDARHEQREASMLVWAEATALYDVAAQVFLQ